MFRHVYACLVHDEVGCVIDLVRNLRRLDERSAILLYNGGPDRALLNIPFPFGRYGATVVPAPRHVHWGRLEPFAIDVLRFACESTPFDALTIVDSDQLLLASGYVDCLAAALSNTPNAGLVSTRAGVISASTDLGPVRAAYDELPLWSEFVRQIGSSDALFHWSFWPGTVFTRRLADACVKLFETHPFADFLASTRTWALEEVLFPTLAAAWGMDVVATPRDDRYLRFRAEFTPSDVDDALGRPNAFWIHPVPRQYGHPVRTKIREEHAHYRRHSSVRLPSVLRGADPSSAVLHAVSQVEGWLEPGEAELLVAAVRRAALRSDMPLTIVEVGSYCGRSTTALALALKSLDREGRVYAVDPHDGYLGALDGRLEQGPSSGDRFLESLAANGAAPLVEPVRARSIDVAWQRPIDLLFVDALHDYVHTAVDFHHFEPWLRDGALVAFHDYADYYPGVQALVDDLLAGGSYRLTSRADSLVVLERACAPAAPAIVRREPFVTCVMPTRNRQAWVDASIGYFLAQSYVRSELLIVDDGDVPLSSMPDLDRVRYLRLDAPMTLGAKRNLSCGWARGDLIAHWDDDDWYASWRLEYQVAEMVRTPSASVSGLRRLRFFDPLCRQAWMYAYPPGDGGWAAGTSLCFRTEYWRTHPFPSWSHGEDNHFTAAVPEPELLLHDDDRFTVAIVHAGNTCPKRPDALWTVLDVADVESLMGPGVRFPMLLTTAEP